MKPKNQIPPTSENDAKQRLVSHVYEYLVNSGARDAADTFLQEISYKGEILRTQDSGTGFLASWWTVFWDLYCAAQDKKPGITEPSTEARAFHDFSRSNTAGMSPGIANTSPPGPPGGFMPGGGSMIAGPRYGGPGGNHQMRPTHMNVGGPRMQTMMSQGGPPPPPPQQLVSGPPHPGNMMGSPRYAPHMGHMTPGSSGGNVPIGPEPGPSPGVNRMTPNHAGSSHPQQVGPPNGMQMSGPMPGPHVGGPPQVQHMGGSMQSMQQRNGPHNWQGNFNVNSPADAQYMVPGPPVSSSQQGDFGTMMINDGQMMEVKGTNNNNVPPNQQQDEYIMSGPYGQQGDQGEDGAQIMKLKESLENNTNKDYNDADQTGFSIDYAESQPKW